MKSIIAFLFLITALTNVRAEELNHNDPAVRMAIINHAHKLFGEGKYSEAAKFYRFGIVNWNNPEQTDDLKIACSSLFALMYKTKRHFENKEIFSGCPDELAEIWFETESRDCYPVLKAAPRYPKKAYKDRVTGWVVVEFSVSKRGFVKNVKVIESSNPIFDQSAIDSAEKFLYLPALENGIPVEKEGIKNKIMFELEM
jgi:TonB family protein